MFFNYQTPIFGQRSARAGRISQSHVFTFDRPGAERGQKWTEGGQKGMKTWESGISIGKSPLKGNEFSRYLGFGSMELMWGYIFS